MPPEFVVPDGLRGPRTPSANVRAGGELYRDRAIRALGVRRESGWRLKIYAVVYGSGSVHLPVYEDGFAVACRELPRPAVTADRPGVGFVIFRQGRGVHHLSLNWWDRRSQLFNRLLVRGMEEDDLWVWVRDGEVADVWDIPILSFERDAWVETVLQGPERPDLERYLRRFMLAEPET